MAASDCNMIAMSLKVVGMLALSEELSWQMIDSNGIVSCLEDGGLLFHCSYVYMYKCTFSVIKPTGH